MFPTTHKTAHINVAAIIDYTHVGSAVSSFMVMVTVAQENFTNQTSGVLVQDH